MHRKGETTLDKRQEDMKVIDSSGLDRIEVKDTRYFCLLSRQNKQDIKAKSSIVMSTHLIFRRTTQGQRKGRMRTTNVEENHH